MLTSFYYIGVIAVLITSLEKKKVSNVKVFITHKTCNTKFGRMKQKKGSSGLFKGSFYHKWRKDTEVFAITALTDGGYLKILISFYNLGNQKRGVLN